MRRRRRAGAAVHPKPRLYLLHVWRRRHQRGQEPGSAGQDPEGRQVHPRHPLHLHRQHPGGHQGAAAELSGPRHQPHAGPAGRPALRLDRHRRRPALRHRAGEVCAQGIRRQVHHRRGRLPRGPHRLPQPGGRHRLPQAEAGRGRGLYHDPAVLGYGPVQILAGGHPQRRYLDARGRGHHAHPGHVRHHQHGPQPQRLRHAPQALRDHLQELDLPQPLLRGPEDRQGR